MRVYGLSGYGIMVYGYMRFWMYACMVYEFVRVWVYGVMGAWVHVCGCLMVAVMDVWSYRC